MHDARNANKGTRRGADIILNSLKKLGAGRSIVLDKNGRIIAGNKTAEQAAKAGLDDVLVVKTDGKRLVAVQRMDLDLENDARAMELAIADNRAGELSLDWDAEALKAIGAEIDLSGLFDEEEFADLIGESIAPVIGEDDAPEAPKVAKSKRGEVYQLGDHRLMCGDSTVSEDIKELMVGGQRRPCLDRPSLQCRVSNEAVEGRGSGSQSPQRRPRSDERLYAGRQVPRVSSRSVRRGA